MLVCAEHHHVSSPWLRMSKMPKKILTFHIFHDEYGTIQHYDTKIYGIGWFLPAPPSSARNSHNYHLSLCLQDSALVIEKFKSGFLPPGDIPFEDLSSLDNMSGATGVINGYFCSCGTNIFTIKFHLGSINPGTPQGTPSEKKTSILGTITGGKIKKRSGLLGIFGQNKVTINNKQLLRTMSYTPDINLYKFLLLSPLRIVLFLPHNVTWVYLEFHFDSIFFSFLA